MHGIRDAEYNIGITGWRQNLGRDGGIEEPYIYAWHWGPRDLMMRVNHSQFSWM